MTCTHTPGPWHVAGQEQTQIRSDKHQIAKAWCFAGKTGQANARLLAAAPELLEALRQVSELDCPLTGNPTPAELVEFWQYEKSQGRGEADIRLFALAAIAKATGNVA